MTRIPIDDENSQQPATSHDEGPWRPSPAGHRNAGAGGGGGGGTTAPATSADEGPMQRLQAERDDLYARLARATAEFKNSQRRTQTEAEQRLQYANST